MRFDPWTLGLQTANFLVLLWLLQRFLYRPVLAIIAQRQAAAAKLTADVRAERQALEDQRRDLERREADLAAARDAALAQAREAADAERAALLAKARADAEAVRSEARTSFERERAEIVSSVGRDAARLAVQVARRLLEGVPESRFEDQMLDQVLADVRALPAETRRRIAERVATQEAAPEVVTAVPLDPAKASGFANRLGEALGGVTKAAFRVDPSLIAGVEIRFPFTILRRTWAESLQRIEAELIHDDHAAPIA